MLPMVGVDPQPKSAASRRWMETYYRYAAMVEHYRRAYFDLFNAPDRFALNASLTVASPGLPSQPQSPPGRAQDRQYAAAVSAEHIAPLTRSAFPAPIPFPALSLHIDTNSGMSSSRYI